MFFALVKEIFSYCVRKHAAGTGKKTTNSHYEQSAERFCAKYAVDVQTTNKQVDDEKPRMTDIWHTTSWNKTKHANKSTTKKRTTMIKQEAAENNRQ